MKSSRKKSSAQQKNRKSNVRLSAAKDLVQWIGSSKIAYSPRERFVTDSDYTLYRHLTSSVIRHKRRYEFLVQLLTGKSPARLDREVLAILAIGLVQLEADSRIEDYAAINETVELSALMGKPYLKGFINANLRRFLRERREILKELNRQDPGVVSSHSDAFIKRWKLQFGKDRTIRLCEANNVLPDLHLVVNPDFDRDDLIAQLERLEYRICDIHSNGFSVANPAGLFRSKPVRKGALLVQDRSFQNINRLIANVPKSTVLDLCAAPGGKLVHLEWEFRRDINLLVGCEIRDSRLQLLKQNVATFGSSAFLVRSDALFPPFKGKFDLVVLDAPCSGTGTIRKHPEIKWSRSEQDFARNHDHQFRLLASSADLVGTGGHLLYVTCSLESEENEAVVERFLESHGRLFQQIRFEPFSSDKEIITGDGFYRALTTEKQMGCFAALLSRVA